MGGRVTRDGKKTGVGLRERWKKEGERLRLGRRGGGEERSERGRGTERRNESSRKQADAGELHSALSVCLSLLLRIIPWKY